MYAAKQQRAKLLRKQEVSADSGPPLARTPGLNAHITVQRLEALAWSYLSLVNDLEQIAHLCNWARETLVLYPVCL